MYNYAPHFVQCLCPWTYAKANNGMHIVPALCNVVQTERHESMDTCKGETRSTLTRGDERKLLYILFTCSQGLCCAWRKAKPRSCIPLEREKTTNQRCELLRCSVLRSEGLPRFLEHLFKAHVHNWTIRPHPRVEASSVVAYSCGHCTQLSGQD